ncbi:hypothetical protein [Crocinitomix algicola]|uniref:hypothetical protein n=1 Tax=Crocinitomix algicola TaxID=1740263 RepID=UPI000835AEEB|nr:NigD-like C-terminal domain-containing protein [Crocinitomix algicola]
MKIVASIIVTSLIFIGCVAKKQTLQEIQEPEITAPKAVIVEDFRAFGSSAPLAIEQVTLSKNLLSLHVKYSGGCTTHKFNLIGHRMVTKSLPPKRSVRLHHDNNGDDCREIVQEVLIFDITDLAYQKQETMIHIDGYEQGIRYMPVGN